MRKAIAKSVVGLLLTIGLGQVALADGLRCGTRLISSGDHEIRLLRYCGEPISVKSRFARRLYRGDIRSRWLPGMFQDVIVEEWTFNFGPRRLMRMVRIEDGIVAEVRHLGYGFNPY